MANVQVDTKSLLKAITIRRMTYKQIKDKTGLGKTTLCHLFSGKTKMCSMRTALLLSIALKIQISEFTDEFLSDDF
ncbi:MAG: hypothetical protein RSE43_07770 [Oscillospiraceae bacterium]